MAMQSKTRMRKKKRQRRLGFESLEDRVLLAMLNPGDILVVNRATSAVIRVDPSTGTQTTISSGNNFTHAASIAIDESGDVFAAGFNSGHVIRVDVETGVQTTVSTGGSFGFPWGIAADPNGSLLVADLAAFGGTGGIIRVDPTTGAQTTVSSGNHFVEPGGVTIDAAGNILVADVDAFGGGGGILSIDPITGIQTVVSSGGFFVQPSGLTIDAAGNILVADTWAFGGTGGIIRIDPTTGAQTKVTSFESSSLQFPHNLALDAAGNILVPLALNLSHTAGGVIRVDPTTGAQTVVASGGTLLDATGIAIVAGVNTKPTANDDGGLGFATDEDTVFTTGSVLTNDTDPDASDVLMVQSLETTGTLGLVTDNGDGTFGYDPNGEFEHLAVGATATDTFVYTVSDGHGGMDTATVTITIDGTNDQPDITGTDISSALAETDTTLTDTGTLNVVDLDLSDTVTITVDSLAVNALSTFGGTNPLTNAAMKAMMAVSPKTALAADPAAGSNFDWTFTSGDSGDGAFDFLADGETLVLDYTLKGTDSSGATSGESTTDTQVVTVTITGNNDNPHVTSLNSSNPHPCVGSPDGAVSANGTFSDADLSDTHTVTVDWGDDSAINTLTVDQLNDAFSGSHTYSHGGIYQVIVTVLDEDGGVSLQSTTTSVVTGVGVVNGTLYIIGTTGDDHVTIKKQGNGLFKVHADFLASGTFVTVPTAGVGKIISYLCEGDDHLTIAGNIDLPAIIHAGADNDHVSAGGGPSVLLGDGGDDVLIGGSGRDVMIGGLGQDRLVGGSDDDVLIGGSTNVDDDDDALMGLLTVWASADDYDDRVSAIDLLFSVDDDEEEDTLTGSSGLDLFYDGLGDTLTDVKTKKNAETVR